jgi:hypothetical protein
MLLNSSLCGEIAAKERVRLVPLAGGSSRPKDTTASVSGATATPADVASHAGAMATARAGAGPGGSVSTTAYRWGRRAVVTWQLLIGPFELKFDRLNMNSTV